jgi:hypothetical protein
MKTQLILTRICLLGTVLLEAATSVGQRVTKVVMGQEYSLSPAPIFIRVRSEYEWASIHSNFFLPHANH